MISTDQKVWCWERVGVWGDHNNTGSMFKHSHNQHPDAQLLILLDYVSILLSLYHIETEELSHAYTSKTELTVFVRLKDTTLLQIKNNILKMQPKNFKL